MRWAIHFNEKFYLFEIVSIKQSLLYFRSNE